jgi:hypothetical protein
VHPHGGDPRRAVQQHDFELVKTIWKYLQRGYRHKAAYQMALEELKGEKERSAK